MSTVAASTSNQFLTFETLPSLCRSIAVPIEKNFLTKHLRIEKQNVKKLNPDMKIYLLTFIASDN